MSFAHFHQNKWLETFLRDSRAEVVGFWDDNPVRAASVAKDYGVPYFNHLDELLQKSEVTAAAICSETSRHKELTFKCCQYQKQILCEKPTALTLNDCLDMKRAVESSGVLFLQSFPQRLIRGNKVIKTILDSGELGRITHVRKRHGHGFGLKGLDRDMPWIVSEKDAGGGAYMDEGVHETDLLCYYFGMPESVFARLSKQQCGEGEMSAAAIYRYENDLMVIHEAGWNWLAGGPTTEIYGEEGVLIESQSDCASSAGKSTWPHLSLYRRETGNWEILEGSFDFSVIHSLFPLAFMDMLLGETEPVATIDDGINALMMVLGAYRSAREGRIVSFPLERD